MSELIEHLRMYKSLEEAHKESGITVWRTVQAFVLDHGRHYKPQPGVGLPEGIEKGRPKQCFRNCADVIVWEPPDYIYVEGFALSIIPIHHAWLVDREGNVIDPTWDEPGAEYFGVPFDRDFVMNAMVKSGYYGILDNHKLPLSELSDPDKFLYKGEVDAFQN